jgi:thiosulfate/3-mercaptopyruvate sulfurtransferase
MDDVHIVSYDPTWPARFAVEAEKLRAVLDPSLVVGIEHFGSTAIPDLAAKPVIDILVAVTSLARAKATLIQPILGLGYVYWSENPATDRMFFVKGMPPYGTGRTHHIHITEPAGEMWRRRLHFRDHLRANPDEARRYEALKQDLATRFPDDRERYTQGKTAYIEALYRRIGLGGQSMGPLVTTEWLAAELGKPDLVVFDATKYLPNEDKDGRVEFRKAHIPAARYFDIDEVADTDTDLPHMVPSPGRFAKLMAALGVGNATRVVFYDQKGLASAARGWWLMGLFGHDNAAVLDGGLPKWLREGRPAQDGAVAVPSPAKFQPDYRATRLRGVGDVLGNVATQADLVLDARAAGRFTGAIPEPRAGMRSGHIPGSTSVPYTDLLNADGTFKPAAAVRARFAAAGVDGSKPVVTSCGSGVTACILTLGLRLADLPEGAVYDGSWTEWGGRSDTPVATG